MAATKIVSALASPAAPAPAGGRDKKISVTVTAKSAAPPSDAKASAKALAPPSDVTAESAEVRAEQVAEATASGSEATATEVPVEDRIAATVASIAEAVAAVEAALTNTVKELKANVKAVQKDLVKYKKVVALQVAAASKKKSTKAPSSAATAARKSGGFQKPTGVSDKLADFLKIPRGTLLPRMEVTRKINQYILENSLRNPNDRRQIVPNAELHDLLGTTAETEVSYFNYQGFLKGHFVAAPAAAPAEQA